MPKRSNNFQILVELLERQLAPTSANVIGSQLLQDARSGEKREVDIVIETSAGIHPILIGIEVIDRSRPASSPWVESIAAKHADLPINKTILVSRSGFYKPALLKAESLKMDTLTVQETTDLDWKAKIDKLKSVEMVSFLMPYVTDARINFPKSDEQFWANLAGCTELSTVEAFKPNGDCRGTFGSILDRQMAREEFIEAVEEGAFTDAGTIIEGEVKFEKDSYVVGPDGSRHSVFGITFTAKCRKKIEEVSIDKGRYRDTAVGLASGASLGHPVQVAFTENCADSTPKVIIRIARSRSGKGGE